MGEHSNTSPHPTLHRKRKRPAGVWAETGEGFPKAKRPNSKPYPTRRGDKCNDGSVNTPTRSNLSIVLDSPAGSPSASSPRQSPHSYTQPAPERVCCPPARLTLRFSLLGSCRGSWMKFPQRLCFVFCIGSCAEGVRFSASRKIPVYVKIPESPRAHKAGGPSYSEGAACSTLSSFSSPSAQPRLPVPANNAAASPTCSSQKCFATEDGRRGSRASQPAEGPGGLRQRREGCALPALSPRPLEESLPRRAAAPRRHRNRRARRPEGAAGRRQPPAGGREGFNPFSIWSRICPRLCPHPSLWGHCLLLVTSNC